MIYYILLGLAIAAIGVLIESIVRENFKKF